jgi:lysophospholipase L1-like esterase
MTDTYISSLPVATALTGTERLVLDQTLPTLQTKRALASTILAPRKGQQRGILGVMPTPPTIAYGTVNAVSTLNGNAAYVYSYSSLATPAVDASLPNTTGPFRWSGFPTLGGTTYPNYYYSAAKASAITTPFAEPMYAVEFDLYGDAFEFSVKGLTGVNFQMFVDDQPIALDPTVPGGSIANNGSHYRIKATFAAVGLYRIRLELGIATRLGGIDIAATHDIMYPSVSGVRPRCVLFGDSYVSGSGTSILEGPGGLGSELGRVMGWDVISSGYGSTGYLAGAVTFRGRVANDVIALAPDIVVILGGLNDQITYTPAQIATEAGLLLAQIRAGLPYAQIYVAGIDAPGGANATNLAIKAALLPVCAAQTPAVPYIDIAPAFTRASGLISADTVHPNYAGYRWLGRWIAARIQG